MSGNNVDIVMPDEDSSHFLPFGLSARRVLSSPPSVRLSVCNAFVRAITQDAFDIGFTKFGIWVDLGHTQFGIVFDRSRSKVKVTRSNNVSFLAFWACPHDK